MSTLFQRLMFASCLLAVGACSDEGGGSDEDPNVEEEVPEEDGDLDGGRRDSGLDASKPPVKADAGDAGRDGGNVVDAGSDMDAEVEQPGEDAGKADGGKADAGKADAAIADAGKADGGKADAGGDAGDAGNVSSCTQATAASCFVPAANNPATCPAKLPGDNDACPNIALNGCVYQPPAGSSASLENQSCGCTVVTGWVCI